MSKKNGKKKAPKARPSLLRNFIVLAMTLSRKGGRMKDRRTSRGGGQNKQREYHLAE